MPSPASAMSFGQTAKKYRWRTLSETLPRILDESRKSEFALLLAEPFCIFGEIAHEKETCDGHNTGKNPFNDENPSPATMASQDIHFTDRAS
ncbi:hypothetical protein EYZ11_007220 [Aspergillus tanneri]|uniref:Uncharacterized protein n=1 Tax=Aspergillus tanneri TaxID=1220188 RepID=A0A4S3JDZ8_9EURO|nr:hypothetical protein EYZ11_007220 [Aspergillus tanneri]